MLAKLFTFMALVLFGMSPGIKKRKVLMICPNSTSGNAPAYTTGNLGSNPDLGEKFSLNFNGIGRVDG